MRKLIYIGAVIMSSCMSVEKATDYLKDKGALAKVCDDAFPPQDPTITYIPSTDSALIARQRNLIDSLLRETGKVAVEIQYKDTCSESTIGQPVISARELEAWQRKISTLQRALKIATDSLRNAKPDTVLKEVPNRFREAALEQELGKVDKEKAHYQERFYEWRKLGWILIGIDLFILALLILWLLYRANRIQLPKFIRW